MTALEENGQILAQEETETFYPTLGFRWKLSNALCVENLEVVYEKVLQQRFMSKSGAMIWKDVPEVNEE